MKAKTTVSLGRFLATGTSRPCSRPRMHACIMKGERVQPSASHGTYTAEVTKKAFFFICKVSSKVFWSLLKRTFTYRVCWLLPMSGFEIQILGRDLAFSTIFLKALPYSSVQGGAYGWLKGVFDWCSFFVLPTVSSLKRRTALF